MQLEESTRVASASIEESKGLQASLAKNAEVHSAEVHPYASTLRPKVTEATLRGDHSLQSQLEESRLMATRRSKDEERFEEKWRCKQTVDRARSCKRLPMR